MTQRSGNTGTSAWDKYVAAKALMTEAAQRAKQTHRERREQESEDEEARNEARVERASDAAGAREERAAELEAERTDQDRRGTDLDAERMALAKERHNSSVQAREETLKTTAADRSEAITSAAQQAAATSHEHAEELAAANDTAGAEYRALMEVRAGTAARMREYRAEREMEGAKIEAERRNASGLMARRAREARRIRELEDEGDAPAPRMDPAAARSLSALISKPGKAAAKKRHAKASDPAPADDAKTDQPSVPARVKHVEKPLRVVETTRKEAALPENAQDSPHDGRGLFGKILRVFRRAA